LFGTNEGLVGAARVPENGVYECMWGLRARKETLHWLSKSESKAKYIVALLLTFQKNVSQP